MGRLSASEARARWSDVLDKARVSGERTLIHKNGRDVAAVVSVDDLALLREVEDRMDARAALAAIAEGDFIPWEQVKADLASDRARAEGRRVKKGGRAARE